MLEPFAAVMAGPIMLVFVGVLAIILREAEW